MTKKEIFRLSVTVCQGVLREYFGPGSGFADEYFTKGKGLPIVKKVYEQLEPRLLTEEPKPDGT